MFVTLLPPPFLFCSLFSLLARKSRFLSEFSPFMVLVHSYMTLTTAWRDWRENKTKHLKDSWRTLQVRNAHSQSTCQKETLLSKLLLPSSTDCMVPWVGLILDQIPEIRGKKWKTYSIWCFCSNFVLNNSYAVFVFF